MKHRITLASLAIAAMAPAGAAAAAPQMLGLVATNGAVPLVCEGGACTVRLTAFCLEHDRATPVAGVKYRALPESQVFVRVTSADGRVVERPAESLVRYASTDGMTAVRVHVDRRALALKAGDQVALRVGARVSLVPVAAPDDTNRHSAEEIETNARIWRTVGDRVIDRGGPASDAARQLTRLINVLPERGRDPAPAVAWKRALGDKPASADRPRTIAARHYRSCVARIATMQRSRGSLHGVMGYWGGQGIHARESLRLCLEGRHREIMTKLNVRYWNARGAGM